MTRFLLNTERNTLSGCIRYLLTISETGIVNESIHNFSDVVGIGLERLTMMTSIFVFNFFNDFFSDFLDFQKHFLINVYITLCIYKSPTITQTYQCIDLRNG